MGGTNYEVRVVLSYPSTCPPDITGWVLVQRNTHNLTYYQDAIALLDTRRRVRRPSAELARDAGLKPESRVGGAVLKGRPGVVGMSGWMEELGHSVRLSILPVNSLSPFFAELGLRGTRFEV